MFTSSILCYFSGNTKNPDYVSCICGNFNEKNCWIKLVMSSKVMLKLYDIPENLHTIG